MKIHKQITELEENGFEVLSLKELRAMLAADLYAYEINDDKIEEWIHTCVVMNVRRKETNEISSSLLFLNLWDEVVFDISVSRDQAMYLSKMLVGG